MRIGTPIAKAKVKTLKEQVMPGAQVCLAHQTHVLPGACTCIQMATVQGQRHLKSLLLPYSMGLAF